MRGGFFPAQINWECKMKKLLALGVFGLLMVSQAQAQTSAPPTEPMAAPTSCEGGDKAQVRSCNKQKLKDARKALERKIADTCKKQGVKGPDMAACHVDMLAKAANAIN
jgi:hypothetical protein